MSTRRKYTISRLEHVHGILLRLLSSMDSLSSGIRFLPFPIRTFLLPRLREDGTCLTFLGFLSATSARFPEGDDAPPLRSKSLRDADRDARLAGLSSDMWVSLCRRRRPVPGVLLSKRVAFIGCPVRWFRAVGTIHVLHAHGGAYTEDVLARVRCRRAWAVVVSRLAGGAGGMVYDPLANCPLRDPRTASPGRGQSPFTCARNELVSIRSSKCSPSSPPPFCSLRFALLRNRRRHGL